MLKLLGPGLGTGFGAAGGSAISLRDYKPPWEIEIALLAPDDTIPWNFWMNFIVLDAQGKNCGMWTPGVKNVPRDKRHRIYDSATFKVEFDREIPETILAHKPLYMLIQCVDNSHVRLGFRAGDHDPWLLSRTYDASAVTKGPIGAFGMHCWSTTTGTMYGAPAGGPMYQKFLIDYVHYRYGLSANP